ncbi:MAG: hypothetical protein R3E62_08855 [Pseudomonadales bacterium]|jgi:hypothetical protein
MAHTSSKFTLCFVAIGLLLLLAGCSQQQFKALIDPNKPFEVDEEWDGWWSQSQSDVITFAGDDRIMGAYLVDTKTQLCFFIAGGGATQIPCSSLARRAEWVPIITWVPASQ